MSLYEDWQNKFEEESKETQAYFDSYLEKEKQAYQKILGENLQVIEGSISELGEKFSFTPDETVGFIDGINESIVTPVEIESLEGDSIVRLEVDFRKLYKNMLNVPAPWLFGLEEWTSIYSIDELMAIKKENNIEKTAKRDKVGRNEPCPCGSGKKYKKCCGKG